MFFTEESEIGTVEIITLFPEVITEVAPEPSRVLNSIFPDG